MHFIFLLSMPLHPDLLEKLKAEKKLQEVISVFQDARARGVETPWEGIKLKKAGVCTLYAVALLVDFPDNVASTPLSHYDSLLSSLNTYPTGSLREYYLEQSYGKVEIITHVYGWFRMDSSYAYYVNGQYGFGTYPRNCQRLTEDAVHKADPTVDFSIYDNDSDGYIDALFIIHAGPGAEVTGNPNDIWSHAWVTYNVPYVDGVYAYRYSAEPEDGKMGVFSHELGHALFGLPDMYDYDYDSHGLGYWTIMAAGSWLNGGNTPACFDAWCKIHCGFVSPETVKVNRYFTTIPCVNDTPVIYYLYTDGAPSSEYFLVEYRKQKGFDSYIPGMGLFIYHVDDLVTTGNDKQWYPGYTDSGHYHVALEQADSLWELEKNIDPGDGGDPYPGSTSNFWFNNDSKPNSQTYSFEPTWVGVEYLSWEDSLIRAHLLVQMLLGDEEALSILNLPDTVQPDVPYNPGVRIHNKGTTYDTAEVCVLIENPDGVLEYLERDTVCLANGDTMEVVFSVPWIPGYDSLYYLTAWVYISKDTDSGNDTIKTTLITSPLGINRNEYFLCLGGPFGIRMAYSIKGKARVEIFNVAGRKIFEREIEDTGTLTVRNIPPGMYFTMFNTNRKKIIQRVIVVK